MSKLTDSPHFVSWQQMPTFDVATPVLNVYQELARLSRGCFVVRDGAQQVFVKGGMLANEAIKAPRIDLRRVTTEGRTTIGALCRMPEFQAAVIAIEPRAVAAQADVLPLQDVREDRVYVVIDDTGPIGYFLNHESVVDPATKRIHFICGNGHRNPDPDHGSCYVCPAPIVGTEQE